jgi:hypothetical protein
METDRVFTWPLPPEGRLTPRLRRPLVTAGLLLVLLTCLCFVGVEDWVEPSVRSRVAETCDGAFYRLAWRPTGVQEAELHWLFRAGASPGLRPISFSDAVLCPARAPDDGRR